jgi:hypothetical protein
MPAPVIDSVDPPRGPASGGYAVTIRGENLNGASRVTFGSSDARAFHMTPAAEVVAIVPPLNLPGAQTLDVHVTAAGGISNPMAFTAIPRPEVTGAVPANPADPDTDVTITGRNLEGASAVFFETTQVADPTQTTQATQTTRIPSARITQGSPPGATLVVRRPRGPTGPTNITVVTPGGTSDPISITFVPDRSQRWIFALQMAYIVLLIAGLVVYNDWEYFRAHLPNPLGPIPLGVPWFGALGAVTLSISGMVDHRSDWDRSYAFWHVSRPVIGLAFGAAAYLAFAAGVLASNGTPQNATSTGIVNNLFYYIVAFVVGFREETFRSLIKRVSDVILGPGASTTTLPQPYPPASPTSHVPPQGSGTPAPVDAEHHDG